MLTASAVVYVMYASKGAEHAYVHNMFCLDSHKDCLGNGYNMSKQGQRLGEDLPQIQFPYVELHVLLVSSCPHVLSRSITQ